MNEPGTLNSRLVAALALALRAAVAAGATVAVATALKFNQMIPALIASVIVMDPSPDDTRRMAVSRLAGTVLGAAIAALIGTVMPSSPWSIGLGVLASMLLTLILRLPGAANLSGYTCGIVLLNSSGGSWLYAGQRLRETVLGITMAVLVSFVPKLLPWRSRLVD